ncbi:serine hydrolase domain-containing protein [Pseudonocardia sp. GCM10023141]|uniref:serine hydrolase domain-containing protein n=1 Tax=Pseudonocardia sp. GCM10023141 TaxID=3252653 RepID=UPI00361DAB2F
MRAALHIEGEVAPGFEGVRDAFAANFDERGDVGASCAVHRDGRTVVDLWGGMADPETGRPWTRTTTALVYSTTKGVTAVCVHLLAERGVLDLDAPVATYWPEFAAGGKAEITVADVLSHRSGLPVLDERLDRAALLEGSAVTATLARQAPLWTPGTAHGYHALTYGWLLGEIVRRASGRRLGAVLTEDITGTLGLDLWIGLPADHETDVAPLLDAVPDPGALDRLADPAARELATRIAATASDPTSLLARAASSNGALPTPHAATWNDPAARRAEIPAANAVTNARSLARLYAACIGEVAGLRLLAPATVERARTEQVRGPDAVTIAETRFGLGFRLPTPGAPMLGEGSFGHNGAGGSLGFADVDAGIGFGYVPNQMVASPTGDPRTAALIAALREALARA